MLCSKDKHNSDICFFNPVQEIFNFISNKEN